MTVIGKFKSYRERPIWGGLAVVPDKPTTSFRANANFAETAGMRARLPSKSDRKLC